MAPASDSFAPPDRSTGVPDRDATSYVGMAIFVASWALLFAALFASFAVLRIRSPMWPPAGAERPSLLWPLVATAAIALSSVAMRRGFAMCRGGNPERCLGPLLATMVLGGAFLLVQGTVWWSLWRDGLTVRTTLYGSMFYLLTCFHALHVLVGLFLVAWLLPGTFAGRTHRIGFGRFRVVAMYWHFVSVIWGVTFVAVYLV